MAIFNSYVTNYQRVSVDHCTVLAWQELAAFMRETLQRDPFWTGGQKVPWLDLRGGVSSHWSTVHSMWVCLKMLAKPRKTQWFCWSLSLWKMAISLGILTQHFQTNPCWSLGKKARVFTGGSGASSQKQARTWASRASRQIPQQNEEIHAMHRN